MLDSFRLRVYTERVLSSDFHRSQNINRENAFSSKPKTLATKPTLSLSYHPHSITVKNILLHNLSIFRADPSLDAAFSEPPIVSSRRDRNPGDLLFHSRMQKLSSIQSSQFGTKACSKPISYTSA